MGFLRQFFANPIETGALTPSSRKLATFITDRASLPKKRCVVELGPGNGIFTKEIINRISSKTVFLGLEINKEFVNITQQKCPTAIVYHASALDIKKYLLKHNQETTDCIISALPWSALGQNPQTQLLDAIYDSLDDGGEFLTIAYIFGLVLPAGIRFRKLLDKRFRRVKRSRTIWGNIFPAFVYHCIK